jgi:hypothetical protein
VPLMESQMQEKPRHWSGALPAKTRSRLDAFHTGCHFARGGSRKGSKGNAVHVPAHNPAAAPATVSGELAT